MEDLFVEIKSKKIDRQRGNNDMNYVNGGKLVSEKFSKYTLP